MILNLDYSVKQLNKTLINPLLLLSLRKSNTPIS